MINSLSSLLTTAELSALQMLQAGSSCTFTSMLSSLFPFFKENNGAKSPLMSFLCQISKEGKFLPRSHYRRTHTHRHTCAQITPFCKSKNASASTCSWSRLALPALSVFCAPLPHSFLPEFWRSTRRACPGRLTVFPSTRFFPKSFEALIPAIYRSYPFELLQVTSSPASLARLAILLVHFLESLSVPFEGWVRGRKIAVNQFSLTPFGPH